MQWINIKKSVGPGLMGDASPTAIHVPRHWILVDLRADAAHRFGSVNNMNKAALAWYLRITWCSNVASRQGPQRLHRSNKRTFSSRLVENLEPMSCQLANILPLWQLDDDLKHDLMPSLLQPVYNQHCNNTAFDAYFTCDSLNVLSIADRQWFGVQFTAEIQLEIRSKLGPTLNGKTM